MTVKRMLGVGVLTVVVTAGGFVLPPAVQRLDPPAAVVPGDTRPPVAVDTEAVGTDAVDTEAVDTEAGEMVDAEAARTVPTDTATP